MPREPKRNGKSNGHATMARSAASKPARVAPESSVETTERLPVLKTYKIYVGGKFPRTESGRYYVLKDSDNKALANICDCSRKDFRDAVVAARSAQGAWASRAAFNRGQVLYRIAEMLEGRAAQFVEELKQVGSTQGEAKREVELSIDRWLYYAGWADKYQQVFSSVNPVSTSHFNFSLMEPTGVVAMILPETSGLLGLTSLIAPAIVGGNTVIALASEIKPLGAISFAEVLGTSDLPGGVVNLLTGRRAELTEHFAGHMDVNAIVGAALTTEQKKIVQTKAALNVKRVVLHDEADWTALDAQHPYHILDTQEVKTTWHPIGT